MNDQAQKLTAEEVTFADAVSALRRQRNLSQAELVEELNRDGRARFTQSNISRIEKKTRSVTMAESIVIADYFGRSVARMMDPAAVNPFIVTAESFVLGHERLWTEVSDGVAKLAQNLSNVRHAERMLQASLDGASLGAEFGELGDTGDLDDSTRKYVSTLRDAVERMVSDDERLLAELDAIVSTRTRARMNVMNMRGRPF